MNKKILVGTAAAVLVVAALVAIPAFAGGFGWHGCRSGGGDPARLAAFATDRVDDLLDDVDATPDQRARVHAAKDRLLAAGEQARSGRKEAHDAVVAEWKAERPDAARLHALVDARVEEMRALAHQAVDAGVEVHGALTAEQREKLARKAERWHR